jgi:hypothetical protein
MSCAIVRDPATRIPFELATAFVSVPVWKEPYAMTPASSAAAMTARTASARNSGVAPAVGSS